MYYNTKTNESLSTRELRDLVYDYWDETIDDDWMAEMIDDAYGPINIFNTPYSAAYVFMKVDPLAYRCAMVEEVEYQTDDTMYDIERAPLQDGETLEDWGLDFVVYKEENEE